jgi:hypothetical protein
MHSSILAGFIPAGLPGFWGVVFIEIIFITAHEAHQL